MQHMKKQGANYTHWAQKITAWHWECCLHSAQPLNIDYLTTLTLPFVHESYLFTHTWRWCSERASQRMLSLGDFLAGFWGRSHLWGKYYWWMFRVIFTPCARNQHILGGSNKFQIWWNQVIISVLELGGKQIKDFVGPSHIWYTMYLVGPSSTNNASNKK